MTERLQKFLARAGVASRRAAESLIEAGRVTVNGRVVETLGTKVDPDRDAVKVDGRRVRAPRTAGTYLMLHKPRGYVTTLSDPEGRPTVAELIPRARGRVYPVGRLDFNSEGVLLVTDDGELANRLMQPASRVLKTYLVKVRGQPTDDALRRVAEGITLDRRRTLPAEVRMVRRGHNAWVELTVVEGRKHLVRRLLESVGHPVMRLRRTRFAGVALGKLPSGRIRALTEAEVDRLRTAAGLRNGARGRSRARSPGPTRRRRNPS